MQLLQQFGGTYRGLTGLSEAPRVGEIEVVLGEDGLTIRVATRAGIMVLCDRLPLEYLEPLSAAEIAAHYAPGVNLADATGFKAGDTGLELVRRAPTPDPQALYIVLFGLPPNDSVPLWSPDQVNAGEFEAGLQVVIQTTPPTALPLLRHFDPTAQPGPGPEPRPARPRGQNARFGFRCAAGPST
jgi:hypothetical protein